MMHPSRRAYVEDQMDEDRGMTIDEVPNDYNYDLATGENASALLSQFERKRLAARIAVPTNDDAIKAMLRERGVPITLFGENNPADRRERLRDILTTETEQARSKGQESADVDMEDVPEDEEDDEEQDEEYYTRGDDELLQARVEVAKYSLPRAKRRVQFQREEAKIPLRTHVKHRKQIKERLQDFELQSSQVGGQRYLSVVRLAPEGQLCATGDWGGSLKVLSAPELEVKKTLRGHTAKIGGVDWFPGPVAQGTDTVHLASSSADGAVHLWSLERDIPLASLAETGGTKVNKIGFHPSGRFLATACDDTTWRLYDVAAGKEIVCQEGHSRAALAVSFQSEGALVATAGMDSIGRVWDLRSGRTIMLCEGHIQPITSLGWIDGHRILSGSLDGFVRVWDVRKVQSGGNLAGNTSGVTDLRVFRGLDDPVEGEPPGQDDKGAQLPKKSATFFASCGFDRKVNVYSMDDYSLISSLESHTAPVSSVDISRDGRWIVSGSHDRTIKLWARNEMEAL
ncbi:WD40 repeat-like protein [Cryphonectria parasitica EP155]|uniref:WD40 repeat-like protein n=1 Tax=Cryphonectria parasitica (strain ATCC 38755 / EP155) TaxID=660469 RepID=A0A9P4XX31_CRYP1|nr:WD40 repeat-like protein [Cryphonectria parasitica EP155]KAF3762524.1 WD40 repeat-like protein [Cryphonectria parasitica EP155]